MKQFVVGQGERVAMAPTLKSALSKLFEVSSAVSSVSPSMSGTAESARGLFEKARDRLKAGDWAGFGEAFDALGRALEK